MFGHQHYVPILKGRLGEYTALQELPRRVRERVSPLIEIPPIPWDYRNDQPAKDLNSHLEKTPGQLEKAWDNSSPIFIDTSYIGREQTSSGRLAIEHIFNEIDLKALQAVPVTSPGMYQEHHQAVANIIKRHRSEVCIRVATEDALSPELAGALDEILAALGVGYDRAHLILDFKALEGPTASFLATALHGIIGNNVPNPRDWLSLTVAVGSFPVNMSSLPVGESSLPRTDWRIWRNFIHHRMTPFRLPAFGDYAIAHPEIAEIDPRTMNVSANIRYTTEDEWLIFRGRNVQDSRFGGFRQFSDMSKQLVAHPSYCGAEFSWGDGYIHRCANETDGPGNLTTWRKVATNHHVTFVARQIANLPGF